MKGRLIDCQDICELVILTATGRQLVMSRGKTDSIRQKKKLFYLDGIISDLSQIRRGENPYQNDSVPTKCDRIAFHLI